MSLFAEKVTTRTYGYFGYEGACCDHAIRSDNIEMVKEIIERGWITKETETLDGLRMVKYARKYGAEEVAKFLVLKGWIDEKWSHPVVEVRP